MLPSIQPPLSNNSTRQQHVAAPSAPSVSAEPQIGTGAVSDRQSLPNASSSSSSRALPDGVVSSSVDASPSQQQQEPRATAAEHSREGGAAAGCMGVSGLEAGPSVRADGRGGRSRGGGRRIASRPSQLNESSGSSNLQGDGTAEVHALSSGQPVVQAHKLPPSSGVVASSSLSSRSGVAAVGVRAASGVRGVQSGLIRDGDNRSGFSGFDV